MRRRANITKPTFNQTLLINGNLNRTVDPSLTNLHNCCAVSNGSLFDHRASADFRVLRARFFIVCAVIARLWPYVSANFDWRLRARDKKNRRASSVRGSFRERFHIRVLSRKVFLEKVRRHRWCFFFSQGTDLREVYGETFAALSSERVQDPRVFSRADEEL